MADERRPLLNPVLKFNKDPRPEGITGRGKALAPIRAARLPEQRVKLSNELMDMARSLPRQPRFAGHALVYASMFEDSLAPTWTPHDLFQPVHGASLVAPYKRGYLIEMQEAAVERLSAFIRNFGTLRDQVDIAGVETIRFFKPADALGDQSLEEQWQKAPERQGGRAFFASLIPLRDVNAAEHLLQVFASLRDGVILAPSRQLLLDLAGAADAVNENALARAVRAIGQTDRIARALREYRQRRRAGATVVVPNIDALGKLVASGVIMRLDPVVPIVATWTCNGFVPVIYLITPLWLRTPAG